MQSKIRIEYDFDTKQPVLRITHAPDSDDLRDTMLKAYIQSASFDDSRLYVTYPEYEGRKDNSIVEIRCEPNVNNAPDINVDMCNTFLKSLLLTTTEEVYRRQSDFIDLVTEWLNGNNDQHNPIWKEVKQY